MARGQWSINNGHRDSSTPGLLSKELLQDEETLLSFMMDPSVKSSLHPAEANRKVKSKTRTNCKKLQSQNGIGMNFKRHPEDSNHCQTKYVSDHSIKSNNHDSRTNRTGTGTLRLHVDRKGNSDVKKTPKRGSVHCRVFSANGSQTSLDLRSSVSNRRSGLLSQSKSNMQSKVPDSVDHSKTLIKIKLPKESRANRGSHIQNPNTTNQYALIERSKGSLQFDNENDGYFSDAEMSDSDKESVIGKVRRSHLDSGNEDFLRRSILAT